MLIRIGITLVCLGLMMADSKSLVSPVIVIAIGALLIAIGRRPEDGEEAVWNISQE